MSERFRGTWDIARSRARFVQQAVCETVLKQRSRQSKLSLLGVPKLISILDFAYLLGFRLYDWQSRTLLRYEAGERTAVAACNFSGKTSVVFTVAALWTLYCFPRGRLMYRSIAL